MAPTIRIIVLAFALVAPFSRVFAEADPGEAYFTFAAQWVDDEVYRGVDDTFGVQLGMGYAMSDHWNLEGVALFAMPDGNPGQTQRSLGADLQFVLGRDNRFTPYVFAGAAYQIVTTGGDDYNGTALSTGLGFRWDLRLLTRLLAGRIPLPPGRCTRTQAGRPDHESRPAHTLRQERTARQCVRRATR